MKQEKEQQLEDHFGALECSVDRRLGGSEQVMVLFLSSNEHTNLLDFLEWDVSGHEYTLKKMVGNFVLKQFVVYDMRNFSHCTEIVLDRIAFGDTDIEFVDAIRQFLMMYQIRVSVICEGLKSTDYLFQKLLNSGVGNIVNGTYIEEIQAEIRECLSGDGMKRYVTRQAVKKEIQKDYYSFECENIKIAFVSTVSRIGVTTVAIGMTSWLASVGAKVNYVEANGKSHLSYITKIYQMEQTDNGYREGNAYYCNREPIDTGNFIIYDFGNEYRNNMELVEEADILVLVCGTKPYELEETISLLKEFKTKKSYVLCSFVAEKNREIIKGVLETECHQIIFSEYQPDFLDGEVNSRQFKRMILNYIAGA